MMLHFTRAPSSRPYHSMIYDAMRIDRSSYWPLCRINCVYDLMRRTRFGIFTTFHDVRAPLAGGGRRYTAAVAARAGASAKPHALQPPRAQCTGAASRSKKASIISSAITGGRACCHRAIGLTPTHAHFMISKRNVAARCHEKMKILFEFFEYDDDARKSSHATE